MTNDCSPEDDDLLEKTIKSRQCRFYRVWLTREDELDPAKRFFVSPDLPGNVLKGIQEVSVHHTNLVADQTAEGELRVSQRKRNGYAFYCCNVMLTEWTITIAVSSLIKLSALTPHRASP
jgi:hypothetical protein